VRESRPRGSVRGAARNGRPYRENAAGFVKRYANPAALSAPGRGTLSGSRGRADGKRVFHGDEEPHLVRAPRRHVSTAAAGAIVPVYNKYIFN